MNQPSPNVSPSISPTVRSLHKLPFDRILSAWDALDDAGTDREAARQLVLGDRYYLLIKVLYRLDAWHPWIYARCREVEADPDGHIDI